MKKSLSLIKFLGAGFLSLGAISISAAAMNHTFSKNQNEVDATSVDTYYSTVSGNKNNNQQGTYNSLLESINTKITNGISYTAYDNLKTAYAKTYVRSDGYTYDIYSDVTQYTAGSAHTSSSSYVGGGYNKEHTIPQSYWGKSTSQQGCDLFIVLPSDTYVNGIRSNYPYGITSSGTSYRGSGDPTGNRLGDTTNTSYVKSGTVFEPFESRKGDLARIYFYAVAMYLKNGAQNGAVKNWTGGGQVDGSKTIFGSGTGYKSFIYSNYLNMLLDWHKNDPVSADEIKFNNAIEGVQKNRNPFIDHPSWVDIIWGGTYGASQQNGEDTSNGNAVVVNGQIEGTTPSTDPTITINPTSLTLTEGGSTGTITATVANGSGNVTWESSDTDVVTVSSSGTNQTTCTVTPVAAGTTTITASYSTATPVTCSVTVNSSGGGGEGGDDPVNDVLFAKGFGGYTTGSYSAAGTDYSGIANSTNNSNSTYAMQVFNGSTGAVRGNQSGANNFSIRNTTTYSDHYVSSVSLTVSGGTLDGSTSGRSVVYFGTSAYSNPNTTAPSGTATTASPTSSGQATLTWTNTDTTKNYFILYNLKTSGAALSESANTALTVTWSPVSGGDDPTLTGITIKTAPTKTTYTSGEFFSPTNLVITTNYSDSSYDTDVSYVGHTSDFTFSPSLNTALKTNNDKVTITYGGKSADQAITVNPSSITASPKKDTYYVGETISAEDITVTDNDGFDVTGFTFSPTSYQFVYGDSSAGGIAKNKTFTNAVSYANKTTSVTFSVNRRAYVTPSSTQEVTDAITATDLTATGTTYTDFSNVAKSSTAKYAGQSAKDGSGNIQLRSKNSNSGLVSTASGGTIKSVTITVGSGSNTIDVYGKNTAYTDATDLYSTSTQGTKVGYLTSTGTITFTSDYTYVGIRSNNGAIYISSIEIIYKGSSGQDDALNVSNFIMYEDTNNQCNTKLDQAITKLNTMSETEKDLFWTPGNNYVIATAKTRLQAWATSKGKTLTYEDGEYSVDGAKFNIMFKYTESSSLTLILIMISITSTMIGFIFVGYYLKKKER